MTFDVVKLRGSRYEMGVQQGRIYRMLVGQINVFKVFREMSLVQAAKPVGGPPFNFVFNQIVKNGGRKVHKTIKEYYPNQYDRLLGLAEGFAMSEKEYSAVQFFENLSGDCRMDMKTPRGDFEAPPMGCTAGLVSNDESSFIAKNYDFPQELEEYQIIRYSDNQKGGYKTLGLTEGPHLGMITGINEKGVAITLNAAYSADLDMGNPPATVVGQEALEVCKTTEEVVEMVKEAPLAVGWIFCIIDRHGKGVIVERTPNSFAVREMNETESGSYLGTGNTFNCKPTIEKQLPWGTVWNIGDIKGMPVVEPSLYRGQLMEEKLSSLLDETGVGNKLDPHKLMEILASHERLHPDIEDSEICRHHVYYKTLSAHIMDVKNKTFYFADGNPCKAKGLLGFPFKFDYPTPDIRFYERNVSEDFKDLLL